MRLLSLAPSNTEILFALGLGRQIIAVTNLCDYPKEAKTKVRIGSWITTNPGKIKQLSPDLIFTSYFLPPILKNWKGPGKIVHVAPKTLKDVYESILVIERYTNRIKQAEKLIEKMKTSFAQITLNLPNPPNRPKVYMEEWPKPPMASGNWIPELVKIAGGIPVIAKRGKPSSEFDFASLMRSDPDIMIFHWCGFGKKFDKDMIRKRPDWNRLKAVKNDRMYVIDDSLLNRPGPRLVEGTKKIRDIISSL